MTFEQNAQTQFKDFLPILAKYLGNTTIDIPTALAFCRYLKWADLHNIELQFNFSASDISQCDALNTIYFQLFIDQDQQLGYIASNMLLRQIHDQIQAVSGQMAYEDTHFYRLNAAGKGASLDEQKKNNADDKPNYYFYVTSDLNMRLFLSGLMGK